MTRPILMRSFVDNARELRKNPTDEERRLWYEFLCTLPVKFTRQKIIKRYIVDFCCPSRKLVIELDGAQHYEEEGRMKDAVRDDFLSSMGYTVLRYSNLEINNNFRGVCEDIWNHLFPKE